MSYAHSRHRTIAPNATRFDYLTHLMSRPEKGAAARAGILDRFAPRND
jgi:hypothetical protein